MPDVSDSDPAGSSPPSDGQPRIAGLPLVVWVVIAFAILVILLAMFGLLPNTPL